jgi:NAD(P)H-dependent FMN reductase
MNVLGIVASPRREKGLSHQVVSEVLAGAHAAGAQTDLLYLIDEEPHYCIHCGHACFAEGDCVQEEAATARSQRVEGEDALLIAAPVYVWQPCGLAAAFFDKVRLTTGPWTREGQHGRPALGIAVAGGTGTGVFPALQSIYAWLCLWKFRPLEPLPVTRFNLDRVLDGARSRGRALAECLARPFAGVWDQMLTYDALPYMDYGRVDEFRWLAEQIVAGLERRGGAGEQVAQIQRLLAGGETCAASGDRKGAAQKYVAAYQAGAGIW